MTQLYFVHCAIANNMISGYMLEIANKSKNKYTQLNIGRNWAKQKANTDHCIIEDKHLEMS